MYLANDGEIDPADAMKSCWQHIKRDKQPKQFYVPLLPNGHDPSDKTLRFAEITAQTKFANNRFGIAEPVDAPLIDARKLDLVLLPLVGFDIRGNRIGMGGGFYDATFAANRTGNTAPQLVGLAHDCQCVDAITADNWDIAISAVVTDKRIYHCADLSL